MTLQDDARKFFLKSRTALVNIFVMLSGLAGFLHPVTDELLKAGVEEQTVAVLRAVLLVLGAVGMWLRSVTGEGLRFK